jgi:hypothetical protein
LGCIGSRSSINYGCETGIRRGKKTILRYFDIANIDRYDAIIGTAFMHEHRLVPDVYERIVYSGGIHGDRIPALALGEEETILKERSNHKKEVQT